jgi:hypothetical protein
MAMRFWRFGGMLMLLALAAEPCSMSAVRKLWAKKPGAASNLFAFERNGRVGFIDPTGNVIINPTIVASIDDVGDFSNGRARVGDQGYIDETGKLVIQGDYRYLHDFSDGLVQVAVDDPSQKYLMSGLILDPEGNVVARVPAFRTSEFSENLAAYEADRKPSIRKFGPGEFVYRDYPGLKGFIDRTGKVVIKARFADVGPFVGGLARAALDGYCHLAMWNGDRQGTPTTGYPGDCGGAPSDAVAPCAVGFINPEGAFVIQPRFESAQDFREGLAAVRIGGLWGFINPAGTLVISPRFEQTQSFQEGLAAVKMDGKWGFVDKAGVLTITSRFEDVESFSDSVAIAYSGERSFYIDRGGRTKIAGPFLEATPFVHGLAAVLLSEKHVGYINQTGKIVFEYFRR